MTDDSVAQHWDVKYSAGIKSAWTQNNIVQREINRRMTGDPTRHWLNWFFETQIGPRPTRLLSIGCGDGAHEIIIARNNYADEVVAFDASPAGVAQARAIVAAEGLNARFEVKLFEEFAANPPRDAFDMVLFAGSMHHVRDLEGMLFGVQSALKPGGIVLINEYVGPAYQLYPPRQLELVNIVLRLMDPAFLAEPGAQVRLPTMRMIYDADPSEGVRAPLIPSLMPRFFEPVFEHHFGGALLHALFDGLDGAAINDDSEAANRIMKTCIDLENSLTAHGYLSSDFLFGCYRNSLADA